MKRIIIGECTECEWSGDIACCEIERYEDGNLYVCPECCENVMIIDVEEYPEDTPNDQ